MCEVNTNVGLNIEKCLSYLILKHRHLDGFAEHTNPSLQANILKKAYLAGILELFKTFSAQDLLLNLDNVAHCQSILEFCSSFEDKQ